MYSPPHKVARRKQQGRTTPSLPPVLSHVMTTTAATIVLVAVLVSCTVKARAQDAYGFFPSTGSGMCPAILNSPLPLLLQQQQQQLRNDSATSSHDGIKPSSDSRKDGPQGMQPCTDMLVGDYTCSDLGTFVDGNPDYDVSTTPYGNFWEVLPPQPCNRNQSPLQHNLQVHLQCIFTTQLGLRLHLPMRFHYDDATLHSTSSISMRCHRHDGRSDGVLEQHRDGH